MITEMFKSRSNSGHGARGILQLHCLDVGSTDFPHAALGIPQVISQRVPLLVLPFFFFLFSSSFYCFTGGTRVSRGDVSTLPCSVRQLVSSVTLSPTGPAASKN